MLGALRIEVRDYGATITYNIPLKGRRQESTSQLTAD
jgi:hypothetical protein